MIRAMVQVRKQARWESKPVGRRFPEVATTQHVDTCFVALRFMM